MWYLVIFCKSCKDEDSNCQNGRGNKEIIADESTRSSRNEINDNFSVFQEIPVSMPDNPVTISMDGVEFVSFLFIFLN